MGATEYLALSARTTQTAYEMMSDPSDNPHRPPARKRPQSRARPAPSARSSPPPPSGHPVALPALLVFARNRRSLLPGSINAHAEVRWPFKQGGAIHGSSVRRRSCLSRDTPRIPSYPEISVARVLPGSPTDCIFSANCLPPSGGWGGTPGSPADCISSANCLPPSGGWGGRASPQQFACPHQGLGWLACSGYVGQ